jgi:hypothetical protein
MTLRDQAARSDAAARYQQDSIRSAESFLSRALAEAAAQAHAEQTRTAADRQAQLPVIVGGTGNHLPVVPDGNVTVARPGPHGLPAVSAPLPALGDRQPIAADALLEQFRNNGSAAIALKDWPTAAEDLPFAAGPMAMVVNAMPKDDADLVLGALEEAFDLRPSVKVTFMKAMSGLGRQAATVAGDPNSFTMPATQTRGPNQMAETLTKADAQKRFAELTKRGHDLRSRNDHIGAREAFAERDRLSEALHPGDGSPTADQSGHKIG